MRGPQGFEMCDGEFEEEFVGVENKIMRWTFLCGNEGRYSGQADVAAGENRGLSSGKNDFLWEGGK